MLIKKYIKETLKYLLRSYPFIKKYIKEIDGMYEMTEEELFRRNEQRFLEIFHTAYNKSKFYRKFYSDAGVKEEDIKGLHDISKLPFLTKDIVKANTNDILTKPKWKLIKAVTSGTTGTPLTVYENWESIWREQAYFYCYRKRCGFNYGEPLASMRGSLGRRDTTLYIHASNILYLSSFNVCNDTVEIYYSKLLKHGPKAIEGFPSTLYNLALLFKARGYNLKIPLCFTSSETMLYFQKETIEKVFNTTIFDHYGTTERTIRISEYFDHKGYFEDPGYSVNEYMPEGSLSTSLINDAFPLIRYYTGDLIEMKEKKRWPDFIKIIKGRYTESVVGKDGTVYSGVMLTFVFKDVVGVLCAQFVQDAIGHCYINIVRDNTYNENSTRRIMELLDEKVGLGNIDFELRFVREDEIIYTKRNKFKFIVSEIGHDIKN